MKRRTLQASNAYDSFIEVYEADRTATYGPTPINPFKAIRETLDITMVNFAEHCHLTKQSLIRLEQGTFVEPLDGAMQFVVSEGYSFLAVRDQYYGYQQDMRKRNTRMFAENFDLLWDQVHTLHPFRVLRDRFNLTYVAKSLCLSQASLEHFENRVAHQTIVPKALVAVLEEIGYRRSEILHLEKAYGIYRQYHLKERRGV
jgi:DNA-binding XRE family transcriptional regulator